MKERNNFKRKALFHVTKVLWHLDIFRRSFRELSGHACMADSCIFCALKDLFGQLQFSHERALPPDALRKALAQSFSDQHRFQLGFMDDAAECFENILLRIHFHIAYNEAEDMCNANHCIPHQKFAMTLVEQSVCGVCHATSEPLPFTQMVHYVSASALISQAKQFNGASHPDLFGQLLKKAGGMGDIRDCPSSCGAKIQIRRTLINRPEIVSVGIVWDSDRPSLEHIMSLLDTLRIHLRLSDVFHGSFDSHPGDSTYHQLVGVVTYYGKHYSTFFFHTKLRVWVYFDDANVREVGPHWEHVVEKCRRGRYQPLLLLFATPNGTPVDASHAPKSITLVDKPTMSMRGIGGPHDMVGKPPLQRSSLSPTGSLAMGGRRSLTPSPEKPPLNNDMTQRRAVTPNPEQSAGQVNGKPVLPNNDYQNLAHFQEVVFNRANVCDGQTVGRHDVLEKHIHPMRKELVRRDSGNWSGDRNSASSSSSTSLENPYHYILGKMHLNRGYGGIPRSPNKNGDLSSGSGNSSGGPADPGYDSFSLSSTDSIPIQQNLKYNFQLAQIPEGHQTPTASNHINDENTRVADDCERLCAEVDQLLDRSERAEDLITALSLCNAAVNKARAAMDAPYSNPQTASFATMKHNACVLRARTLHRKLEEPLHNNLKYGEARHSREGSGCSGRGSAGSHSRQNSKDKGNGGHSRQNSQELLDIKQTMAPTASQPPTAITTLPQPLKTSPDSKSSISTSGGKISPSKNIEIYATLPKNKKGLLSRSSPKNKSSVVEDEEYLMKERPGRSLLGNRSKAASKKEIEKRARSEERNTKSSKDVALSTVPSSKEKERELKEQKKLAKQEEKQNKKQHKIRRKLLMGGLMRRKNRSMPDLRDESAGEAAAADTSKAGVVAKEVSKDDSMVNAKTAIQPNLSGYLSEGNLEYAGNPNLERSKLMRKSFHGSKLLPFNKVPPPPPLRTTSQLSKTEDSRSSGSATSENSVVYANNRQWCQEPTSLPFLPCSYNGEKTTKTDAITYSKGGYLLQQPPINTVVTEAQIHHEASFQSLPPSIDEPDFVANKVDDLNFQLPPYPSPIHSTVHSRQASEEFPPPPPSNGAPVEQDCSFLNMLQEKCEKLMDNGSGVEFRKMTTGGENWLRELQAKQAERRKCVEPSLPVGTSTSTSSDSSVKDLKSKFEQLQATDEVDYVSKSSLNQSKDMSRGSSSVFHRQERSDSYSNLKNAAHSDVEDGKNGEQKRKSGKKKNVTFCEQVVLVATADDDEADSYIPNPILERVLRTVLHKESTNENKEHAVHSMVPLKRSDSWRLSKGLPLKPFPDSGEDVVDSPPPKPAPSVPKEPLKSCLPSSNQSKYSALSNESVDEVDAPSMAPYEKQPPARQNVVYANSQAYSPTYIPASSLCGPAPSKSEYSNDYPEQASLQADQLQNGYADSYSGSAYNQIRKFDNHAASETPPVRYSPICNTTDTPAQNGFHGGYNGYQSSNSSSYQPMSLQYYPSSNQSRSSPQIGGYREQAMKNTLPNNSHYPSSLTRQNSNVSHFNKQLPPTDPRKMSVSSSPRLSDGPRSQYYNMVPQQPQFSQQQPQYSQQQYSYTQQQQHSQQQYNLQQQQLAQYQQAQYSQQQSQYGQSQHSQHQYGQQQRVTNGVAGSYGGEASPKGVNQSNGQSSPSSSGHQSPYQHVPISSSHYTPGHSSSPHLPSSSSSHHQSYSSSSPQYSAQQTYPPNHHQSIHQSSPSNTLQHHPSHLPSSTNNGSISNGCDSLPRNSSAISLSPYQSIPHNANSYEMHCSRNSTSSTSSNSNGSCSTPPYQHVPFGSAANVSNGQSKMSQHRVSLPPVYQHPPPPPVNSKSSLTSSSVYQRVPTPNQQQMRSAAEYNGNGALPAKYSPYQHPPMPKQPPVEAKKANGISPAVAAVPCNLCRKKQISPPSVYCTDCDFYISRFKQKG